ncbi:hypothetical protein [uncultured Alistipes sp.]|uniref:hypothetical protein n=1 Tax=uncultured Alistipes sp. TaxID=538949 RepID=UPI00320B9E83
MEEFPIGFLYILLGVIVVAVVLVILSYGWKQRKLQRLQHTRKDYTYRKKRG